MNKYNQTNKRTQNILLKITLIEIRSNHVPNVNTRSQRLCP